MELYYTIFSLVLVSCLFEKANNKAKKCVLFSWGIFFTLFGGLRWQTGGDWDQYYNHFLASEWSNIFSYDRYGNGAETLEPGFVFINVLVKSIFSKFYWYNILLCGFIQYTYIKVSKYYAPERPIMMYAFLTLMNANYFPVRQGLSITIALWAFQTIKERKLKTFLLLVFIAFNIHNAALILLPAYWIGRIRMKPIFVFTVFLILMTVGFYFQDTFTYLSTLMGGDLGEKALRYTEGQTEGFDVERSYFMGNAIALFLLFVYLKVRDLKVEDERWMNILINSFVIYYGIAFMFREGMGDLTRLKSYYFLPNAILFMYSLKYLKYYGKTFKLAGTLFFVLYMAYQVSKSCDGYYFMDANVPYKTIFDYNYIRR